MKPLAHLQQWYILNKYVRLISHPLIANSRPGKALSLEQVWNINQAKVRKENTHIKRNNLKLIIITNKEKEKKVR